MNNFFNNLTAGVFIFFEALWQIISGVSNWVVKAVIRFLSDVFKHIYGKTVALTAVALLAYFLTKLK
jgi:hypothetical protein